MLHTESDIQHGRILKSSAGESQLALRHLYQYAGKRQGEGRDSNAAPALIALAPLVHDKSDNAHDVAAHVGSYPDFRKVLFLEVGRYEHPEPESCLRLFRSNGLYLSPYIGTTED